MTFPETAHRPLIRVSAVVLHDEQGRILTVRKRGTHRFMLPGGKPEPDETPDQTVIRETAEEVGLSLDATLLEPLGTFRAAAANEVGHELESHVFVHPLLAPPRPDAEIEELRWLDPHSPLPSDLAPMIEHNVLPALADRASRS